jgi:pimeloyl-ACP methyl ester carboxylesterase
MSTQQPGGAPALVDVPPSLAGSPTEQSLVAAASHALTWLDRESSSPIFRLGESLGSAAAVLTAAQQPRCVARLILVTPLLSVPSVARRHFPCVPTFLIRDAWHADEALPHHAGPVAFLVAGRDSVVFPDLGEASFSPTLARKRICRDARADHTSLNYEPSARTWGEMLGLLVRGRD